MSKNSLKQQIWGQYNSGSFNTKSFDINSVNFNIHSLWRYHKYLPLGFNDAITMGEGFTPLLEVELINRKVFIKQEQLFPTGSYKDRGATVLVSYAKKMGVTHVVQDSSGNAGCSIAAYAANANIACDIFVPADTSKAKLAQVRAYGANLILVDGDREATAANALLAAQNSYYASHCYNPLFLQGTKTFAYEVCEQLGWKAPDVVVLPAGNGTLVLGCYIGFKHLFESNIIAKMPKIVAVQAQNCAPLYTAWKQGLREPVKITSGYTLAEGIAIADPTRGKEMISAVNNTQGIFVTVDDDEIINALKLCTSKGFYIEPTSAATIAGLIKAQKMVEGEIWVTLFSGHGLKSTEKILSILDTDN
jgi:threonine synthase